MLFRKRRPPQPPVPYDPTTQIPAIRASICTGEQVAGFREKQSGRFTEVMLITSAEDRDAFCAMYGLSAVKTEY